MSQSTRYNFCVRMPHHTTWAWSEILFGLVYKYGQNSFCYRILCALEGMYLVQQSCSELMDGCGSLSESDKGQSLSFPCSIPNVMGRGFIEVMSCLLHSAKKGFSLSDLVAHIIDVSNLSNLLVYLLRLRTKLSEPASSHS